MKHLLFSRRRKSCLNSERGSMETLESFCEGGGDVGIKNLQLHNSDDWLFQKVDPIHMLPKEMGISSFAEWGARATTSHTKQNGLADPQGVGSACKTSPASAWPDQAVWCSTALAAEFTPPTKCFSRAGSSFWNKASCWVLTHHFCRFPINRGQETDLSSQGPFLVSPLFTPRTEEFLEQWHPLQRTATRWKYFWLKPYHFSSTDHASDHSQSFLSKRCLPPISSEVRYFLSLITSWIWIWSLSSVVTF